MKHFAVLCSALAVTGLFLQTPAAQPSAPARAPIEVSKLGPQVGQLVPDFSLKDQNGKVWTRQSIMGPRGAMLVFFRSADW
jgi:hypothetical protein